MSSPKFKQGTAFVVTMVNVSLTIPREANEKLLAIAKQTGETRTDLIRSSIDQYLEGIIMPETGSALAEKASDEFLYGIKS